MKNTSSTVGEVFFVPFCIPLWINPVFHGHVTLSLAILSDPTAPPVGSLLVQSNTQMLHAQWQDVSGTGYVTALYSTDPPLLVQNSSVPKGHTSQSYEGLRPGTHYTLEICTVAGPFISLPLRLSNWTCKWQEKYNVHRYMV